jgi:hypothetical protein
LRGEDIEVAADDPDDVERVGVGLNGVRKFKYGYKNKSPVVEVATWRVAELEFDSWW